VRTVYHTYIHTHKDTTQYNTFAGLFFFGPEYRPIPLDQTFVGVVSNDKNRAKRNDMMNKQAFEKMVRRILIVV
jgi:hypothetical protein